MYFVLLRYMGAANLCVQTIVQVVHCQFAAPQVSEKNSVHATNYRVTLLIASNLSY